jgi:hypothetical protein
MRHTEAQLHWIDGYKPLCRWCQVPCDPMSREYRAVKLCSFCYAEMPPIQTQHKELIHVHERS